MKIALLANASKLHAIRWANGLAARGHEVTLLSDELPSPLLAPGVRVVHPKWGLVRKTITFKIRGGRFANNRDKGTVYLPEIRHVNPDVVVAMEALAYGPALAECAPWPRVLVPWGPDVEGLSGDDTERNLLVHSALRSAEVITTNAPGLERRWSELTGVEIERFYLFAWGVDQTFLADPDRGTETRLREEFALSTKESLVLAPRIAREEYGVFNILDAWDRLRPPQARLLLLRAGAPDEEWQRCTKFLPPGVQPIERWLTPAEMATLYNLSTASIMVPRTDLLALSLLECMACGSIPIVPRLPAYETAVTELFATTSSRGRGVILDDRAFESIALGIEQILSLSQEDRDSIATHNREIVASHFRFEDSVPRLEEAVALARKRHAAVQGDGAD